MRSVFKSGSNVELHIKWGYVGPIEPTSGMGPQCQDLSKCVQ